MATSNKTLSIAEQIKEMKAKLSAYGSDINIHNFLSNQDYKKKFEECKGLTFSIARKLGIKKPKEDAKKTEQVEQAEKFTNFHWAGEGNAFSNRIVSCTNKGNAYVFNSDNGNVISSLNFGSGILNACAIEQTENQMFAVGGFDGAINLKNIVVSNERRDNESETKKFTGHQGGVSAIRFMNTVFMISASFDSVLLLWDINWQGKFVNSYCEHTTEVSGLDVNEVNGNIFATGSGDTTVKIWDIREKRACVATFQDSDSSINCVKFLPGRLSTLATGSEDSTIRLYDLRAVKELGMYKNDNNDNNSINSIGFSKSGSILFASTIENSTISFWNLFGKETPFAKYDYKPNGENSNGGIMRTSINSAGNKIAFIYKDEIVMIQ